MMLRNVLQNSLLLVALVASSSFALGDGQLGLDLSGWGEDEASGRDDLRSRGRGLLQFEDEEEDALPRLPRRFHIRSLVEPSLCVTLADLADAAAVAEARAASGLPPTDPADVAAHGGARLVLMPCGGRAAVFTTDLLLGRMYIVGNTAPYPQAFLKPAADPSVCVWGVNSSYTSGQPMWGISTPRELAEQTDMDWFDDYNFEYAPYITYNYNVTALNLTNASPIKIPDTMFDASGWGPFHSSYGPCMENPTVDRPIPIVPDEVQLAYMSWAFIGPAGRTNMSALSHVADPVLREAAYVLMTMGPERPRFVDFDPQDEHDAGYDGSLLISRELCITAPVAKAGAEVRLAQCRPASATVDQLFFLLPPGTGGISARNNKRRKGRKLQQSGFKGRFEVVS